MDHTTRKLVRFASTLSVDAIPAPALEAARARILSALGVSLAAYDMPPVRITRKLAQPVAAGPAASVWGSAVRTTPDTAAFVNSAMVRCLDMSDSYVMSAVSHPADAFPAALAVAEAQGLTGCELLLATVILYEVQARFVEVVPYNHHGWDQTPVVALGAALACARLLKLTPAQMGHAVSLAVVPNIALNQTRTGTLSMWKGMAGPQGARAGVNAAYMAREGMTGPDGVFEGRYGFWNQLMGRKIFELPIPTRFSDHTFAVQQTMIKSFPTRFNCQVPVFTAQQLRSKVNVAHIQSLKIESIRQAFARWMDSPDIWQPKTRETADHSLPCTVAMALLDGTITPAMMENERYKSADVLTLMARCRIELPDEFAALAPQTRCCRITATLNDGRVVTSEVRRSLADDTADTGWAQAVNKFMQLTEKLLPRETRAKIVEQTAALETLGPLREWVALTTLPN
jgi:2-methylcitrate dehydratase